jgi:hypothetical protein
VLDDVRSERRRKRRWWYLVLIVPFIAVLFPQLYAGASPTLGGIPYFYWYQLLWVVITGLLTIVVHYLTA